MSSEAPEGWQSGRLGQFLKAAHGGGTPPRDNPLYWGRDLPWASVKDVTRGSKEPLEGITAEGLGNSSSRRVAAGTNIMATRMAVGSVIRYEVDVAINQDLLALIPADSLNADFLFQWLRHHSASFAGVATGTTVKGLRKDVLLDWPILLPPPDEQRQIAEVLHSVDQVIGAQEKVCRQLSATFISILETCFSAADWPTHPLGDLCASIQVGIVVRPASYYVDSGGIPALRSLNVLENRLALDNLVFISEAGHTANQKSSLRSGDVVTRRTGEPGKTAVITDKFENGLNCIDLIFSRPKDCLRSAYLSFFMNSDAGKRQVASLQGGLAQQHLNVGEMKKLRIPLPDLQTQDRTVAVLDDMWTSMETSRQALQMLSGTKARLTHDLLSSRVRVPA